MTVNTHNPGHDHTAEQSLPIAPQAEQQAMEKKVNDFLFGLQSEVEKTPEGMDYRVYARLLWERLGLSTDNPEFEAFRTDLIASMKEIKMDDLVDSDLRDEDKLNKLTDLPGEIVLWTKGDATNTGYQKTKVARAKIYLAVKRALKEKQKPGHVIIAQDKIAELGKYLSEKLDTTKGTNQIKPFRIVVLEDSVKAFTEVQKLIDKLGLGDRATVFPIWFTHTREGQTMQQKDPAKFATTSAQHNGVTGFGEILAPELLQKISPDDHTIWLVDFDGVVSDNIGMRARQLQAKLAVIARHTNMKNMQDLANRIDRPQT